MSWCISCSHRWIPHATNCRGYFVELSGDVPLIRGCKECGVPDKIARWWPEAYRAIANALNDKKMEPVR